VEKIQIKNEKAMRRFCIEELIGIVMKGRSVLKNI